MDELPPLYDEPPELLRLNDELPPLELRPELPLFEPRVPLLLPAGVVLPRLTDAAPLPRFAAPFIWLPPDAGRLPPTLYEGRAAPPPRL